MRRQLLVWVPALVAAGLYLALAPATPDHAAHEYRAALLRADGLQLWNSAWYAGHHTPAYSLLSPPLGALLGARLAGVLAALAAIALFAALARRHFGEPGGTAATLWFAAGMFANLVSGRLAFVLGLALGAGALLALQRGRRGIAGLVGALSTLASPVAGLFVALAVTAWGGARPRARGPAAAAIVAATLLPGAVLALLFPEGGSFAFAAGAFWPALALAVLVAVLLPARERELRIGAILYALLCVVVFALPTPVGGNAARLAALAGGAVLLGAHAGRRPWRSATTAAASPPLAGDHRARGAGAWHPLLLALVLVPFAASLAAPALREVAAARGDPSAAAAYYRPLVDYLRSRPHPRALRVEIPFTRNHWETRYVAPHVALARGWERQLDRRYGALFYDDGLDAGRYRAWLDDHAVALVALPAGVAFDDAGRAEARLVMGGLPYLRPVWRDDHWQVYAVEDPAPLASGAGATATIVPGGFDLRARRAGDVLVRVRHSRWFAIARGQACVRRAAGGMTRVRLAAPGLVAVRARLLGPSCRR